MFVATNTPTSYTSAETSASFKTTASSASTSQNNNIICTGINDLTKLPNI